MQMQKDDSWVMILLFTGVSTSFFQDRSSITGRRHFLLRPFFHFLVYSVFIFCPSVKKYYISLGYKRFGINILCLCWGNQFGKGSHCSSTVSFILCASNIFPAFATSSQSVKLFVTAINERGDRGVSELLTQRTIETSFGGGRGQIVLCGLCSQQ